MIKLTQEEIKNIELDILLEFDKICKKYNLKYYIAGGTLLGAIRHKGFIPWDDDIDVCMPRTDFIKLKEVCNDENEVYELKTKLSNNLNLPFYKLVDKRTVSKLLFTNALMDNQLWIDIFPVDGLPEDIKEVEKIYKRCDFYRKILMLTDANLGEGSTFFRKYCKFILKPLAKIYGKRRCITQIETIAFRYPYETSKYVGAVTWGLYGVGERMLKSEFEKSVEVEFEGYKFPTFSCWDSYLKGLYGDYMKLPAVEERKNHSMTAYFLN